MPSYRRIVRPDIVESAALPQKNTLCRVSIRILAFLCYALRIIWYWFERIFLLLFLLFLTVGLAWWLSQKPSNHRDWLESESILPEVSFSGNIVFVKNVRNHIWKTDTEFIPRYYDASYNLDEIQAVYYLIVPFSDHDGPAHTMLSFSFSGRHNVVISAEIRKERGESFDALKGILNQYEIMYVIGDEADVIRLRTNYRKNEVYMYPLKVEKNKIAELFRSMVFRAERLRNEPEFYNTLWNNCATSILMHANALRQDKLIGGWLTLLPSHSDQILYDAGLIDTKLSTLDTARAYYRIDEMARTLSGEGDYSVLIHKPIR